MDSIVLSLGTFLMLLGISFVLYRSLHIGYVFSAMRRAHRDMAREQVKLIDKAYNEF